jgi:hypothetical protein
VDIGEALRFLREAEARGEGYVELPLRLTDALLRYCGHRLGEPAADRLSQLLPGEIRRQWRLR